MKMKILLLAFLATIASSAFADEGYRILSHETTVTNGTGGIRELYGKEKEKMIEEMHLIPKGKKKDLRSNQERTRDQALN